MNNMKSISILYAVDIYIYILAISSIYVRFYLSQKDFNILLFKN